MTESETYKFSNIDKPELSYIISNKERVATAEAKLDEYEGFFESVPKRALPAVKFHLFTFFLSHTEATEEEKERELNKMILLSEREKKAEDLNNPLPTIGVELEFPDKAVPQKLKEATEKFNVYSGRDAQGIYEYNPDFSHSAEVQARIIEDLSRFIKYDTGEVSPGAYAPFHINIGLPSELGGHYADMHTEAFAISFAVTAAFVSPERIKERSYGSMQRLKPMNENAKHHKKTKERLEIRIPSFDNKSAYSLLLEVQLLSASAISFIKEKVGVEIKPVEKELVEIWKKFRNDMYKLFEEYDIKYGIFFATFERLNAIAKMKEQSPDFEKNFRTIFNTTAIEAKKVISTYSQVPVEEYGEMIAS